MESSTKPFRDSRWGVQQLVDKVTTEHGTMEVWETMPHRTSFGRLLKVGDEVEVDECNYIVEEVTPCGARCRAGKPTRTISTDDEGNEVVTTKRGKATLMVSAYATRQRDNGAA